MFMGLFSRMLGVGHVLFTGLRDGDVTEWYQILGCSGGPLWAKKEPLIEDRVTLYVQQNSSEPTNSEKQYKC